MARLEAQKAICDSSERELHRKFKHRDELESLVRPEWEQARKRSRTSDESFSQDKDYKSVLYLPGNKQKTSLDNRMNESPLPDINGNSVLCLSGMAKSETLSHKELREFLEEEQKASEAGGLSINEEEADEQQETEEEKEDLNKALVALEDGEPIDRKLQKLEIEEEGKKIVDVQCPVFPELEGEEDEESRKQRGKGNVEKWLQILLDDSQGNGDKDIQNEEKSVSRSDEIIRQLNIKYPIKVLKTPRFRESINTESANQIDDCQQQEPHKKKDILHTEARKMHLNTQQLITATGRAPDVEVKNTYMQNPAPYQLLPRKDCTNEANFRGELTEGRKSWL